MIPSEVVAIAELIHPDWRHLPEDAEREVLDAAYRIYEAGYRKSDADVR